MDIITAFNHIVFVFFLSTFLFIIISAFIDLSKKRVATSMPLISFIMPVYNDTDSLESSIKSVFDSCKGHNFELIVVNDKSPDNTAEDLKNLRRKYDFKVINNSKNLGKSRSINNAFKHSKGEIIFMVDSDVILNEKAINDVIARIEDKNVGGASCRCSPINKGFLPRLQEIEYGMLGLIQLSNNLVTTTSFWGGCMAVKREVFEKVGYLSESCIIEDVDLALKIGESGWKAQESSVPVNTHVPEKLNDWYKQRIRWAEGTTQELINHFHFYIKHPMAVMFFTAYALLSISFVISFLNNILFFRNFFILLDTLRNLGYSFITSLSLAKVGYGYQFTKLFVMFIAYPLFSIPYIAYNHSLRKNPLGMLWVFPFSMIYIPIFTVVNVLGMTIGLVKTIKLRKGERGW
jgi:biofilm PGA synthesis N-glycosyltransferase PgaC